MYIRKLSAVLSALLVFTCVATASPAPARPNEIRDIRADMLPRVATDLSLTPDSSAGNADWRREAPGTDGNADWRRGENAIEGSDNPDWRRAAAPAPAPAPAPVIDKADNPDWKRSSIEESDNPDW